MKARVMRVARHRMGIDGQGVSTLVAFWGCPLNCAYCLNDFCHDVKTTCEEPTPEELVKKLMKDEIYYRMTGGGIVFGGGEPLLNADYICAVVGLLPDYLPVRIETSLNVAWDNIELLQGKADEWIIDIKDMDPKIYYRYTGKDNRNVTENLEKLKNYYQSQGIDPKERILLRVPLIPGYNNQADIDKSIKAAEGYGRIDQF